MRTPKAQTILKNEIREWLEFDVKDICKKIVNFTEYWSESELSKIQNEWDNEIREKTIHYSYLHDVITKKNKETENEIYEDYPINSLVYPPVWREFIETNNDAKKYSDVLEKLNNIGTPPFPEKKFHVRGEWCYLKQCRSCAVMLATVFLVRHTTINTPYENNIPTIEDHLGKINIVFIIKTTTRSFKKLLLQIQSFKDTYKNSSFYVVSPDDRHIDLLGSLGIGFVNYPTGEASPTGGVGRNKCQR